MENVIIKECYIENDEENSVIMYLAIFLIISRNKRIKKALRTFIVFPLIVIYLL